jgi:protein SCO1/2
MTTLKPSAACLLSFLTAFIAVGLGISALWVKTDGGRAFTSETARRLKVVREPTLPMPVVLEASDRSLFTFRDFNGHTLVVDFVYTHCPTLCVSLGNSFARLQQTIAAAGRDDVRLISIGFDAKRDTPEALSAYGKRYHVNPRRWTLARVANPRDLRPLLASFGVVVIPDSYGGFSHNAALHVVDPQGRLNRIIDLEDVATLTSLLGLKATQ